MHNDFHKGNIRSCFNRAAVSYDQYSLPQQIIGEKLINLLKMMDNRFGTVIDIGCGSGLVTSKLISAITGEGFYAIDVAEALISIANKRFYPKKIMIHVNDFENFTIDNVFFNLVFSNMALQWSLDFYSTLLNINKNMHKNGLFAFSVPIEGNFPEISLSSKNTHFTVDQIKNDLILSGFYPLECKSESLIFNFDNWKDAIKSIKATGASYLFNRSRRSLVGVNYFKNNEENKASLTYKIGYILARKIYHVD